MNEMIRHRDPTLAPSDSRPDLYLAGMRCVEVRPPTAEEEKVLALLGYGGGTLGTVGALFLMELVRNSAWLRALGAWSVILAIAGMLGLVIASMVAGPALRSLRRKKVLVFRGPVLRLGPFDTNQKRLFENRPYPDEMIVMANGRTVLRRGNRLLPSLSLLKAPSRVAPDRGPDTRKLSAAEEEELRRLIRTYRNLDGAAWVPMLVVPLGSFLILPWVLNLMQVSVVCLTILALLCLFVVPRWQTWWSFSRRLKRDLKDGVITNGNLWSGMPWLVHGEPAPWRTARPEVGVLALDVEVLKTL